MTKPHIFIVEDDEAVRDSLQMVLAETGYPVESYDSADTFLEDIDKLNVGCLILDLRLPRMSGLELLQNLEQQKVHLPTIVISAHGDIPTAVHSMQLGAVDFLQKPFDNEILLERVYRCIDQETARRQAQAAQESSRQRLEILSNREREILNLTARGLLNKQIAYELSISPRTVEVHRANMRQKLGVARSSELIRLALLAQGELSESAE